MEKSTWQRLPGFTLLDVILAMLLGTGVLFLIYELYDNVWGEWKLMHQQQTSVTDILMFCSALENDMEAANGIFILTDTTYVFLKESDTIQYDFGQHKIIRKADQSIDSFVITATQVIPKTLHLTSGSDIVCGIQLNILKPFSVKEALFIKRYTSAELLTWELNTAVNGFE